jgi:hypothetical protein
MVKRTRKRARSSSLRILVGSLGILSCGSTDAERTASLVRLDEVASLPLQEGFVVRTVVADRSRNIVVAADGEPLLLIDRAGRHKDLRTTVEENFLGTKFSTCDSCVRVLTSQAAGFADLDAITGVVRNTLAYPDNWEGEWMNAVGFRDGWLVGGRTSNGRLLVFSLQPSRRAQLFTELTTPPVQSVGADSTPVGKLPRQADS